MHTFHFNGAPRHRHRVSRQPGCSGMLVDDTVVDVQPDGAGRFVALVAGRPERLHAVAHGDVVHVQWRGRTWRIDRVDPTRGSGASGRDGAGASLAPMPGVVISMQAEVGRRVATGEALLVIESMKLQMTISAECSGTVAELPAAVGQTFQRGALLARVQPDEAAA